MEILPPTGPGRSEALTPATQIPPAFPFAAIFAMPVPRQGKRRAPRPWISNASRVDAGYGAPRRRRAAHGSRAVFGAKGWRSLRAIPRSNAKVGLFVLVGLNSIVPTLAFPLAQSRRSALAGTSEAEGNAHASRRTNRT